MSPVLRKLLILSGSFSLVLVVYLLVTSIYSSGPGELASSAEKFGEQYARDDRPAAASGTDVNDIGKARAGKLGEVKVGAVEVARFVTRNKDRTVSREFGFGTLLHDHGNEWEIEKPYMNIYRPDLNCRITADKGDVLLDEGIDRPSPSDMTLTGNVVVKIVPADPARFSESFVYLDDITFVSERSRFATAGPVKFVSADAVMTGRGLELIYNAELDRLESLRVIHLDSLRIKAPAQQGSLFAEQGDEEKTATGAQSTQKPGPTETTTAGAGQVTEKADMTQADPPSQTEQRRQGYYYRCVFSKNVVIDSPGQSIFAELLSIDNIFWQKRSKAAADANTPTSPAIAEEQKTSAPAADEHRDIPEKSSEELIDVVLTCDDGFVVAPMDETKYLKRLLRFLPKAVRSAKAAAGQDRTAFAARQINYDLLTGNTTATGASELVFYTDDPTAGPGEQPQVVPVTITAEEKAGFVPALNQARFEGNCLCTMVRNASGVAQKYGLSGAELIVNLAAGENESEGSAAAIEHLTATGGVVQLDSSRWAGDELLGFTKLKAHRIDYDSRENVFLATGPDGIIALDNSKAPTPSKSEPRFSLKRPSYAVVQGFDTLKYFMDTEKIIAEATDSRMVVDYFQRDNGRFDTQTTISAASVVAQMFETAAGRSRLDTLAATGGIDYEDERNQFVGSSLFYNAEKSVISVHGDQNQLCLLNGAQVPAIHYDLKADRVTTRIGAPGAFRPGR